MDIRRKKPLLSAIVPISRMSGQLKNLEIWLRDSYLKNDLEIILIHDKQDEETGIELRDLIKNFSNVIFSEGYFGSPGATRNEGLTKISGNWICFWDSDDLPQVDVVIERLKRCSDTTEIVIGRFEIFDFQTSEKKTFIHESNFEIDSIFESPGLWRFVFRSDLIKNIEFPKLRMGEDQVFLSRVGPFGRNFVLENEVFYHYFVNRNEQLTKSKNALIDLIEAQLEILKTFSKLDTNLDCSFRVRLLAKMNLTGLYRKNFKLAFLSLKLLPRIFLVLGVHNGAKLLGTFYGETIKIIRIKLHG